VGNKAEDDSESGELYGRVTSSHETRLRGGIMSLLLRGDRALQVLVIIMSGVVRVLDTLPLLSLLQPCAPLAAAKRLVRLAASMSRTRRWERLWL